MHPQFADLHGLEGHVVDTDGQTIDEILAEIRRRQPDGDFRLDLTP
jgi:hypothetical protein